MGTSLSGLTPATTFDGLLKTSDNEPLDGTLKAISTGDGTDTILQLSNSALSIGGDVVIDSSGLNSLIVKRSGTELLKSDGSGLNGGLIFTGNLTNKFSLGVKGNDFNIWDGSYLGGGDLRFSILADGKTGIGNQTPTAQLHIKGSGTTSATTSLLVQNSAGTDALKVQDDGAIDFGLLGLEFSNDGSGGTMSVSSDRYIKLASSLNTYSALNAHVFKTLGSGGYSEVMRITGNTDQFVGIGETTPTARLHVKGSGNSGSTTSLLVQNSDGDDMMVLDDSKEVSFKGRSGFYNGVFIVENNHTKTQGNAIFGAFATPTARLQIKGSGSTSATFALKAQNSGGETMFSVRDDKTVQMDGSRFTFNSSAFTSYADILLNTDLAVGTTTIAANTRAHIKGSGNDATTTALLVQNSDGTDAFKILDDGTLMAPNLPTSATGLPTGAIYNDAGTLKIV